MAKAVTEFWHSAEVLLSKDGQCARLEKNKDDLEGSRAVDGNEVAEANTGVANLVLKFSLWPFLSLFWPI